MQATILRANALTCLGFGALFAVLPTSVANFIGNPPDWLIIAIGTALIFNGLHLAWASSRQPFRLELRYFAGGDFLWALATALLIVNRVWIITTSGIAAAVAVGLLVGTFGILQWRLSSGPVSSRAET